MMNRVLVVTGSDDTQFGMAETCIKSLKSQQISIGYDIAFLDLGLSAQNLAKISSTVNHIHRAKWEFGINNSIPSLECRKGQLCRPFFPDYFPDYEYILWLDADTRVQSGEAIEDFVRGSQKRGGAMVGELEATSKFMNGGLEIYLQTCQKLYENLYGSEIASLLGHQVVFNAGVFCFHRGHGIWRAWKESLLLAVRNVVHQVRDDQKIVKLFALIDQLALNHAIRSKSLTSQIEMLPLRYNWPCHLAPPVLDQERNLLVEPNLPHHPIGVLHLTNPWGGAISNLVGVHDPLGVQAGLPAAGKSVYANYPLYTTAGNIVDYNIALGEGVSREGLRSGGFVRKYDYISPGLQCFFPDYCFPNMTIGDPEKCNWKYLRRTSPHLWYVDKRFPSIGFVSRDEASILYNTARMFQGKDGLEIGCWQGWSAAHIAGGGVLLDVIDPILSGSSAKKSIEYSLVRLGVLGSVNLFGGKSPELVDEIAKGRGNRKWQFLFIDGDHEGQAPVEDVEACLPYVHADSLFLFHDLASPDVANALEFLRRNGWNTLVYNTSQIMGVAWRGNVNPPRHIPDPNLKLEMPTHLRSFAVSA